MLQHYFIPIIYAGSSLHFNDQRPHLITDSYLIHSNLYRVDKIIQFKLNLFRMSDFSFENYV